MSSCTIFIPTPLRGFTNGAGEVEARGETVRQVLDSLFADHEGLDSQLLDSKGELRHFVNIFLDGASVRSSSGLETPVSENSVIHIVPAVAGGLASTSEVPHAS